MIKGFRFTNQLANAEVDARIHQELLNGTDGIFYGMNLSKTSSSITISEGLCEIAGRPVAVINNETIAISTENLYCLLILEIDLTKESTKDNFEQVSFKLLTSSTSYPTVTQQDINRYDGENNLYQLEFARFRSGNSGVIDFVDSRKFLSFKGLYEQTSSKCEEILEQMKEELKNVKDGSIYILKTDADTQYLKKIDAEGKYIKKTDVESQYIKKSDVESQYIKKTDASSTYITKASASSTYLNKSTIKKGTSAPTALNEGEIYFQYFD